MLGTEASVSGSGIAVVTSTHLSRAAATEQKVDRWLNGLEGRAIDLKRAGASLEDMREAGHWKSRRFSKYLDETLKEDVVREEVVLKIAFSVKDGGPPGLLESLHGALVK